MKPQLALVLAAALLLALAAAACGETGAGTESGDVPDLADYEVEELVRGLDVPWELIFTPDGELLITERVGRLRVVRDGVLVPEPVAEFPVAGQGEGGLLGLALHPNYPDEPFLYVYYTYEDGLANRVSRLRVVPDGPAGLALGDEQVLLDGIPAASVHDGGRIAFGPDGMLYVTTGDAGDPLRAADLGSLAGKILRLDPEGGVPDGNPFGASPVWTYGHRNPQGLAWDGEGRLYSSEHGPSGHDELNLIEPGGFYGWPFRAGRAETEDIGGALPAEPVDPLAESGEDTWAPADLLAFGAAGGSPTLLAATLRGSALRRFVLAPDGREIVREEILLDDYGRLRALALGPDDCLYVATSNRDGRADPREGDDRLLRLCPPG